jgi:hypothetical protein
VKTVVVDTGLLFQPLIVVRLTMVDVTRSVPRELRLPNGLVTAMLATSLKMMERIVLVSVTYTMKLAFSVPLFN